MVARQKIRAYINNLEESGSDPSTGIEASRTVNKAYSGFVHAASPQIMDMYGGYPPRFYVQGILGTDRELEYREEIWNYHYRTLISAGLAAKAFGDQSMFDECATLIKEMEERAGKQFSFSSNET